MASQEGPPWRPISCGGGRGAGVVHAPQAGDRVVSEPTLTDLDEARTQQRAGRQSCRRRPTAFIALFLIHMSLNIPGVNRSVRNVQDHVAGIGRLENCEARFVTGPRFAVVCQLEVNRETIGTIVPASA